MNGVHDMGGMDGFGKVEAEPNEPVFHERWEGRVMAMVRAMGANGGLNIDMQRFSRESIPNPTTRVARWRLIRECSGSATARSAERS